MPIKTRDEFKALLGQKSRRVSVAIAYRAAMRVLPYATRLSGFDGNERLALVTLRALITSGVAASIHSLDSSIKDRAPHVYSAADVAGDGARFVNANLAAEAADAAAYATRATFSTDASGDAVCAADGSIIAAIADMELPPEALMGEPISMPAEFRAEIDPVRRDASNVLSHSDGPWEFWARWYRAAMSGTPLPWALQEQIALIPNEIWEAGPEAVAKRIEEIEARFALKENLANAEREIVRSYAQRDGIGGNNPPEAIDDLPVVPAVLEVLWEPFGELKEEVDKAQPDTRRIKAAISKLIALLATCGKWTGEKLDAAATEYVKVLGKWGGGATTVWIASQQPQINAVIVAAKDWLLALLGGG